MFEINLVPDVKNEMIKALKIRNLMLFVCIVASAAAIAVVALLFIAKGGQDIALHNDDVKIEKMQGILDEYDELGEIVTVQNQMKELSSIAQNKKELVRVFDLLNVMVSQGEDLITFSSLNVDLSTSMLTLEAQADAKMDDIDYRVLEAFMKNASLTKYDYGMYVDEKGSEIPSYCINELADDGLALKDEDGLRYAQWYKGLKGCDPQNPEAGAEKWSDRNADEDQNIYRTPKFDEWYEEKKIDESGAIKDVAHFDSQCITYSGTKSASGKMEWDSKVDDSCKVTESGVKVSNSSNGRDDSDNLVLRFEAELEVTPELFKASNRHLIVVGPERQNVTDSFTQLEKIFAKRAKDCEADDKACKNTEQKTNNENSDTTNQSGAKSNSKTTSQSNTNNTKNSGGTR